MFDELNGLQVTREHIKAGQRWSDTACPIALAMKGVVEGTPKVYPKETVIHNDPITTWIHNTPELANWISRFDQGGYAYGPAPITLEVTEDGLLGIKQPPPNTPGPYQAALGWWNGRR